MSKSVRQQARARAMEQQKQARVERVEAERRRSALGIEVAVALSERDAAVAEHELAAGRALETLSAVEGLSAAEVSEWVPDVNGAEVRRLRAIAVEHDRPVSVAGREPSGPSIG